MFKGEQAHICAFVIEWKAIEDGITIHQPRKFTRVGRLSFEKMLNRIK